MLDNRLTEPDYYAVLGVSPKASATEIERAYRRLAGARAGAFWRPSRAARELSVINAAYGVLGYPERRADYDMRRNGTATIDERAPTNGVEPPDPEPMFVSYRPQQGQRLPRVQVGRSSGGTPLEAIIIVLVVALSLLVASNFINRTWIDLSFIQNFGETLGIATRRRPPATPSPAVVPGADTQPSPAPATPTPDQPTAPLGALPTAVVAQRFAGSEVTLNTPEPPRRSDLSVTLKLVREANPVPNANVYLVAKYRTLEERQPTGNDTVRTDANGLATISFNIGDASPGYQVNIDVIALVEGQQVAFQSSFTPR